MKNGTVTGNDLINIEPLKAGEDTISKTLARLYSKCLSERRIPTAWKNAKMVIIFKKRNKKDLKNLSATVDRDFCPAENQPCLRGKYY